MLSNITDDNDVDGFIDNLAAAMSSGNQKVDLSSALPSLRSLIKNYSIDMGDEHYNFLGESAFYFAVNCLLAKKLRQYDDQLLRLTARQFRNIQSFAIPLFSKAKLEKYVRTGEVKDTFLSITGILYRFLGIDAVMQFIEPSLAEVLEPKKIPNSPVYELNHRCASKGGRIEIKYNQEAPNVWKAYILCKLNKDSVCCSVEATSASKLRARTVGCQMILTYLNKNPSEEQKLEAYNSTADIIPLPVTQPVIDMDMNEDIQSGPFDIIQTATTYINNDHNDNISDNKNTNGAMQMDAQIPTQQNQQVQPKQEQVKQDQPFQHIKFEEDEDTIERLSNLLLGTEERAGTKRQRVSEMNFDAVKIEPTMNNGLITSSPSFTATSSSTNALLDGTKPHFIHTPSMTDMDMDENIPPAPQPNEQQQGPDGTNINQFTFFTAPETGVTAKGLFQKIFKDERVKMRGLKKSYDAKGAILSYLPSKQGVVVKVNIDKAGGAQDPHFVANLEIRCVNPSIALYTKGAAKKKREAEAKAYCRLVEQLLDPNAS